MGVGGVAVLCAALAVESIVQVHKDLERSLGFEVNVLVIQPVLCPCCCAARHFSSRGPRPATGSRPRRTILTTAAAGAVAATGRAIA